MKQIKINSLYSFKYDSGKTEILKCKRITETGIGIFRVADHEGNEKTSTGTGINREHFKRLVFKNKHKLNFIKQL